VSAVLTGMGPLLKANLKARPPAFSPLRGASFMPTRRLAGGGLLGAPSRTHRRPKSLANGTSVAPIWEIHPLWFKFMRKFGGTFMGRCFDSGQGLGMVEPSNRVSVMS
jgi:hypothetical protein